MIEIAAVKKRPLNPVFLGICILVASLGLVVSYLAITSVSIANAADKRDWVAGNIISDATFTDSNSMSVEQIQQFLDQNIGTCDIWGAGIATEFGYSGTRAQYAASRGWQAPPYTCLNRYYEVPKSSAGGGMPANNYSNPGTIPSGAQSGAWIIKDAANRYNISPKVLLVKLATESAGPLTSDKWPLFTQFKYAMGAQCPDSGPGGSANCNEAYAGFSIQMYEAAALLRAYLTNMNQPWWPHKKPNQINSILWNVVERGCGASNVFIENKATAALYTYTPYQPNQAALNNMYGTGDNCSAYGNRNFWRVFVDWFGPTTQTKDYSWAVTKQEANTGAGGTQESTNTVTLSPGESATLTVTVKNTGNQKWEGGSFNLGTSRPLDRVSKVRGADWLSENRLARASNQNIAPGEEGTFTFTVTAPNIQGEYKEYFNPLIEGNLWLPDIGLYYTVISKHVAPVYDTAIEEVSLYRDAGRSNKLSSTGAVTIPKGEKLYGKVVVKNTGNQTLNRTGTHLAPTNPRDKTSELHDSSWIDSNRITGMTEYSVSPNSNATFLFSITAPDTTGVYSEKLGVVIEGVAWMDAATAPLSVTVTETPASELGSGQSINSTQKKPFLRSPTDSHSLVMQSDGNLVVYNDAPTGGATWNSGTVGRGPSTLVMQSDGNLVVYSNTTGKATWNSGTVGRGPSTLVMQSDGNLVVYSNTTGKATWNSGTVGR